MSRCYDGPMWNDDLDWLEFTYPLQHGWRGSEAERAAEMERVCLRRLEALCWPEGPQCPKCGARDDAAEWAGAPRGVGWRCRGCKARFHVLQAIPPIARIHQPIALWFRAMFLISNTQSISSIALGERLKLEQKLAWKIGRTIRRMAADYPDLVQRIVNGPAADSPVRRRARKPASATTRKPSDETAEHEPSAGSEQPRTMPSAFDLDS